MRHTLRASLALLAAAVAVAVAPARSAAEGPIAGLDVMTATVFQEGQSSFSGLGLRLSLRSPRLVPNVEFLPTVEYWRNNSKVKVQSMELRASRRDASLGCDARWVFSHAAWRPYVGAGFALHFLDSEADAPALGIRHAHDSLVKGGVAALVGVNFVGAGRLGNFLEVKFHEVPGYRQVKLNMGLTWGF